MIEWKIETINVETALAQTMNPNWKGDLVFTCFIIPANMVISQLLCTLYTRYMVFTCTKSDGILQYRKYRNITVCMLTHSVNVIYRVLHKNPMVQTYRD